MEEKSSSTNPYSTSAVPAPPPTVEIDPDNIIVRFDDDVTEVERASTREKFKVTNFKTCSCGDKSFELWGLDTNEIKAESAPGVMKRDPTTRAKGELNFYFPLLENENFEPLDSGISSEIGISDSDGHEVNIAVLDTGINPNYFNDDPFLYNTSGLGDCAGHTGWNFIGEGSSNVFDDHGHGTYVTKIITETLKAKGIGYRILPLKVLDGEGKGSFWNVLCAMSYLQKIQKEGANIQLVNASLGGTMENKFFDDSDFLSTIINELENEMLVIASAGNEKTDTDGGILRHYPSSYNAKNILAVGGYQAINGELKVHPESNFGSESIDLAVPFEGYKIEVAGLPDLKGTSYGTAYVTALAAGFYKNYNGNPIPSNIKAGILALADMEPKLVDHKINGDRAIVK